MPLKHRLRTERLTPSGKDCHGKPGVVDPLITVGVGWPHLGMHEDVRALAQPGYWIQTKTVTKCLYGRLMARIETMLRCLSRISIRDRIPVSLQSWRRALLRATYAR